jgi:hypothetical protein
MAQTLQGPGAFAGRTLGWVWPLATFAACAAIALRPDIALLVLGAVAFVASAVIWPRVTVALSVLAILGARTLLHLVGVEQVTYLDEAVVVLCAVVLPLRRICTGKGLRALPGQYWFALACALGLAGGLVVGMPTTTLLSGAFVMLKGVLFGWAVAQVNWNERDLRAAARAGVVLVVVCLAAVGANLAAPGAWASLLANKGGLEYRGSIPSLIGPFVHPLDLGQVMVAATISLLAWRATVDKRLLTLVLMIGTGLAALLTFRRTAVTALLVGILWMKAKLGSARALLAAALAVPLLAILMIGPLESIVSRTYADYIVAGDTSARTLLTRDSFAVAAEHFPLGAGFGRFGSEIAAQNYSPEYVARGYPAIWGLGPTKETGQFLTDTEWPAIIGETGLLGAIAFALGLAAIYRRGRRLCASGAQPLVRWAGLTAMGWVVTSLVLSIASVVFTGPPAYALLFGLAGILAALSDPTDRPGPGSESTVDRKPVRVLERQ